jgi:molecular chaperone GrpE
MSNMQEVERHDDEKDENVAEVPGTNRDEEESGSSKKKHREGKEEISRLKSQLKEKGEEIKDLKDKYLRAVADLQNYKKRVRKEIQAAYESSSDRLICDILPVVDNLERALDHPQSSDPGSFRNGVRMIRDMLKAVLEDEGVKEFCSVGEKFDPARHEAVYAVESEDFPAEVVVNEIEKGYMFKNRLLRPARVTVSKGVPESEACRPDEPAPEPEPDEDADKNI